MKYNNVRQIQMVVIGGFALLLSITSSFQKGTVNGSDKVANSHLTAGVSTILSTENIQPTYLTSGVTSALTDFEAAESLIVYEAAAQTVASGQKGKDSETGTEDDGTFMGYKNLAVANVTSMLNVRKEPTTSSSIVGKMTGNAVCEVLGTEGEWTSISSGKVSGYVKSEYLIFGDEAIEIAKGEVMTVATVNTTTLKVREEPNTNCSVLYLVGDGEDFTVSSMSDGWAEIEIDNETGYVSMDYVKISEKLPTAQSMKELQYGKGVSDVRVSLVAEALKYVGYPYVWGGTSLTKGVDCSGFTMKIYAMYGISLPHHSGSQPAYGKKINAADAKPGDLFFYNRGSSIGHVAIYIGNGQIVHASSPRDGIKISNAYYQKPVCVVNYFGD